MCGLESPWASIDLLVEEANIHSLPVKNAVTEFRYTAEVCFVVHSYQSRSEINIGVSILKSNSCVAEQGNSPLSSKAGSHEATCANYQIPDISRDAPAPDRVKTAKDCVFSPFQNTLSEPLPWMTALIPFNATESPTSNQIQRLGHIKPVDGSKKLYSYNNQPWFASPS